MTQAIRLFLLFEATAFTSAALVHFGLLMNGYEHQQAATAESVIGIVLFLGLALSWIRPGMTRRVGLAAQIFALLGTMVGIVAIAVGVGPRTVPDIAYHIGIVVVLLSGLVVAARARFAEASQRA
jgi:hypothetical protein